jgi:excisionase family DNA binding protein
MKTIERLNPSDLSDADRAALERLYGVMNGTERPALVGREGVHIELPDPVFHLLVNVVQAMRQGQGIVLTPQNESLTTQAAANLLGCSRPFLVGLLEQGAFPHHTVGTHRRVMLKDVLAYLKQRDAESQKTVTRLAKAVADAGLYESEHTGRKE